MRVSLVVILAALAATSVRAQRFAPPPAQKPDEAARKAIAAKTDKLAKELTVLRQLGVADRVLVEVEVYLKAGEWIVKHGEFFHKDSAEWTQKVLERGLLRAAQAAGGETPWLHQSGQEIVRAYRSPIDGSVQPFAVTYPADYGSNPRKKYRLDVVLHGRDTSLTEVKFLYQHGRLAAAAKDQDFVRLEVYGRGNNAYRWAGESDVFEAVATFQAVEQLLGRRTLLDPTRVVLRGFSMGGAGSWHLGLHYPDRWCVIGPGAGFSTTHGYVPGLPARLPDYQEKCLTIYDAVDYAENAFDVPVVAYAGAEDPQLQAARNIEAKLKVLGISMKLLVAPGLAHRFPPEWRQKAEEAYAVFAGPGRGRDEYPSKVRFVTYTLKYPSCAWVDLLALQRHYDQARVEAEKMPSGFTVKTANVAALRLRLPELEHADNVSVRLDGQDVTARPRPGDGTGLHVYFERRGERWSEVLPQKLVVDRLRRPRKTTGLQGPIDDAFMTPFLCVRGTGKPWHSAVQKYAEASLERFRGEWDKYLRGQLPVKNDTEVTAADLAARHLVLFGDPGSNSILAQLVDRLPLKWTKGAVEFGGRSYAAAEHVPLLIYPSPVNTGRYVVLNSGHTFHAADFRGTNALLYPRLGDYAILKLAEKDPLDATVVRAGLFDDLWQVGGQASPVR